MLLHHLQSTIVTNDDPVLEEFEEYRAEQAEQAAARR